MDACNHIKIVTYVSTHYFSVYILKLVNVHQNDKFLLVLLVRLACILQYHI